MTAAGRVLDVAIMIARRAPAKQGTNVFAAQIPWALIHELRQALDDLDVPWKPDDH